VDLHLGTERAGMSAGKIAVFSRRQGDGMAQSEQLTIDRGAPPAVERRPPDERAARDALRSQVARLERELSGVIAERFPHISARDLGCELAGGPRLLTLGELERLRDRLVLRTRDVRAQAEERAELERGSRELLERMKLEPGSHKFVRLPVSDLGQGGCGVWEVRPRLGLIGMLAGWWQVKLSSGCPLPCGSRAARDPRALRSGEVGLSG
jgi:hypothetical protein